jgi:branched-subunit amino acid transport protein AzlD
MVVFNIIVILVVLVYIDRTINWQRDTAGKLLSWVVLIELETVKRMELWKCQ